MITAVNELKELEPNEVIVLFLNDSNGHNISDPMATLVVVKNFNYIKLKNIEEKQAGVYRRGGNYIEALDDLNMEYVIISEGRKSDYNNDDMKAIINFEYTVISGNY